MSTNLTAIESIYGIRDDYGDLIGGEWVGGASGKTIALLNPAPGETLARIQAGNAAEVGRADVAAEGAFHRWPPSRAADGAAILSVTTGPPKARQDETLAGTER